MKQSFEEPSLVKAEKLLTSDSGKRSKPALNLSAELGIKHLKQYTSFSPMNILIRSLVLIASLATSAFTYSQVAVIPNPDQDQLLQSSDPKAAANKRLVYDFWREVFEAGHLELAGKYMSETYIQHNPNVATGRAAFVEFFQKFKKPMPIEPRIKAPLVSIVAEGDFVVLSFVSEQTDPKDSTKKYTTTWFDMFRIENGKIAEHWDPATKY